jgi:hypothetical protein
MLISQRVIFKRLFVIVWFTTFLGIKLAKHDLRDSFSTCKSMKIGVVTMNYIGQPNSDPNRMFFTVVSCMHHVPHSFHMCS